MWELKGLLNNLLAGNNFVLFAYVQNSACSYFTHIHVVSIIFSGNVMSRTMHYITYLFNYVVIDGCDYVWLQTCGNTLRKCC